MTTVPSANAAPSRAADRASFYRAVWRWHFYAGLLTLPFLILLSLTGGLYLFRHEVDAWLHRDLKRVEMRAQDYRPASELVGKALASTPGRAMKYIPPETRQASAEVIVRTSSGPRQVVYIDPYDGRVLGTLPDRGTVMWVVRQIHSLAYFGPVANGVIEIVGGWSILLVATGFYLWWPRKAQGGVISVRGRPGQRVFWRDLHAVTGAFAGLFIVFLALSGMPWSVLWGDQVNRWANGHNFGYPAGVRVAVPMSGEHLHQFGPTSWSLEQAKVPESAESAAQPIGLDAALARFEALGLAKGYAIALPGSATGVYTGSVYPPALADQRVIHLDQYSGEPLIDIAFKDYGPLGKTLEWGINVHMGQEFGLANQLLMLAVCVAIILLAVSATVMWWQRRPAGTLGTPPMPANPATLYGVFVLLAIGGVVFPLVGASLVAMLALDRLMMRRAQTP